MSFLCLEVDNAIAHLIMLSAEISSRSNLHVGILQKSKTRQQLLFIFRPLPFLTYPAPVIFPFVCPVLW